MRKNRFKILLVDDEKEFVESLSERLELRNLDADIAYDGEQALQAVKEGDPDVMVLDLRMPGIDGIDVLRRVRKSHPDLQVIILTGHGTDKDAEQARQLGAFEYLQKPVDIDHLVGTLHQAWDKVKQLKESVDTALMAAGLAQAGEVESAREIMTEWAEKKGRGKDR